MAWKDNVIRAFGAVFILLLSFGVRSVYEIDRNLVQIRINLSEVIYKLNDHEKRMDVVEGKIVGRGPSAWHRQDMRSCMLELERNNPNFKGCDTNYRQ